MADNRAGPAELLSRTQEFAYQPDAVHWARACAWVPGTGHCRNRDCDIVCLFRAQRDADARNVRRWRRLRRIFAGRR
jgi:hypothetical protein